MAEHEDHTPMPHPADEGGPLPLPEGADLQMNLIRRASQERIYGARTNIELAAEVNAQATLALNNATILQGLFGGSKIVTEDEIEGDTIDEGFPEADDEGVEEEAV